MFVIGNGESRAEIDISKLEDPKVGCNAIHRDYQTEYLVCVDKRMMQEALDAGANNYSLVYTRPDWFDQFKTKRVREVPRLPYAGMDRPDSPIHWGSGPYAVLIGAMYTKTKEVKLIGFDLYSKTKKVNNVYKDTPNYTVGDKRAIDPSYWIYQIGKVFECFPKVKFTIYQEEGWQRPKAWNYPNVKVDKISNIYYNT
jgi:hypothetical protein